MLKNYFRTAWRNLVKNKYYTAINITGLTTGLAVGILIFLWVQNELSYDRFHRNAGNIYRVLSNMGSGSNRQIWPSSHAPLATMAEREIPEVINAVRIRENRQYSLFGYKDKRFTGNKACYVDPSFFSVFDFKLLEGNSSSPFPGDHSVILTAETAKRYFGDEEPLGKILQADNKEQFVVCGVVEDFPENSSIRYDMLFPMSLSAKLFPGMEADWGNFNYTTFLLLQPRSSKEVVAQKLAASLRRNYRDIGFDDPYSLQPLAEMHLYKADGSEGLMQTVRIFLIVGMLILLIACINYVNIATARSMLRAREVSVRKMIGAGRVQLFIQFVVETTLVFLMAMTAAMVLVRFLMPLYNNISGKELEFNLTAPGIWLVTGATMLSALVLSSIYPALLLSSFEPLKVLKGRLSGGISTAFFRKLLVTVQFMFSVGLITGTVIINRQMNYIHNKELGYDKEYVFTFAMKDMIRHGRSFKEELLKQPGVQSVSFASDQIVNIGNTTGKTDWAGKEAEQDFFIHVLSIDTTFLSLFKLRLVAGHGFTGIASDSANYILNETAVREAGIIDPVGKYFSLQDRKGIIIGVVKDFHFASLKQKIEPAVFEYRPLSWGVYVKTTGKNAPMAIAAAEKLWKKYNQAFPFDYTFLDEVYDNLYKSEQRTGRLFTLFSAIAVLLSCLGLFGLATYTMQVKTKEIGIRKVMGASVANIVQMLTGDFIRLVMIAITIATPLAWYGMNQWLQDFAYRVPIRWWMPALSGLLVIGIALATVGAQSVKAALMNPVKSLRSE